MSRASGPHPTRVILRLLSGAQPARRHLADGAANAEIWSRGGRSDLRRSLVSPGSPKRSGCRRRPPATSRSELHVRRMGEELAGDQGLAEPEGRGPLDQARGHVGERVAQVSQVRLGVHPHQGQIVALGEHLLVHLLRPLGRGEQVEPELPALRGDQDGEVGGQRRDRIGGLARTDVVGLVDDDQAGLAPAAVAPERGEHCLGDQTLLLDRVERPEVDHQAARGGLLKPSTSERPCPWLQTDHSAHRGWRRATPAGERRGCRRRARRPAR